MGVEGVPLLDSILLDIDHRCITPSNHVFINNASQPLCMRLLRPAAKALCTADQHSLLGPSKAIAQPIPSIDLGRLVQWCNLLDSQRPACPYASFPPEKCRNPKHHVRGRPSCFILHVNVVSVINSADRRPPVRHQLYSARPEHARTL